MGRVLRPWLYSLRKMSLCVLEAASSHRDEDPRQGTWWGTGQTLLCKGAQSQDETSVWSCVPKDSEGRIPGLLRNAGLGEQLPQPEGPARTSRILELLTRKHAMVCLLPLRVVSKACPRGQDAWERIWGGLWMTALFCISHQPMHNT